MRVNIGTVVMNTLRPLYGEREARNIAKYLIPEFVLLDEVQLKNALERLSQQEPWQYVIGKEWFYDLEFKVTPDTLIPRPETEELVHLILNDNKESALHLLDIGTGTGCIPIVLKKNKPQWLVTACDISEKALDIARENAQTNNVEIELERIDILNQHPKRSDWDIIVSNPPYIPLKEKKLMSNNVLHYEPHLALFVEDDDPLLFYEKIGNYAFNHLSKSGKLYFELNEFYSQEISTLLKNIGFDKVKVVHDLMDKPRMIMAKLH